MTPWLNLRASVAVRPEFTINSLSAQDVLILLLERLDADADLGDTCFSEGLQGIHSHIIRMKFQTDSLSDFKILLAGINDLLEMFSYQSRGSTAEIQAGDLFLDRILAANHPNLPKKGIQISVAQDLVKAHLAVRAEIADAFAKWNMDVKTQILAVRIGEYLVILIFKGKGLPGPGQPAPGKICNNTHRQSDVFQVSPEHFEDDLHIAPEQEGVFCHKEIATLFTKTRNVNAPSTGADLAVLNDQTLVAGCGELVLNQIGEGRLQIEYRAALVHHP